VGEGRDEKKNETEVSGEIRGGREKGGCLNRILLIHPVGSSLPRREGGLKSGKKQFSRVAVWKGKGAFTGT